MVLLLEFIDSLIPQIAGCLILLYPMWRTRDVKARYAYVFLCAYALLLVLGFLFTKSLGDTNFQTSQLIKAAFGVPGIVLPFWVFRKRIWQNIFFYFVSAMHSTLSVGTGTFVGQVWFPSNALFASTLSGVLVLLITLPPLIYFSRRLYENQNVQNAKIWRIIWILPFAYFCMYLLTNNPLDLNNYLRNTFVFSRILTVAMLVFTIYLLDLALRQASENALLKANALIIESQIELQGKQYAQMMASAAEIRTMRHDIRHHIAVMAGYSQANENEKLGDYLQELAGAVSSQSEERYCKNFAVNAVAAHYLGLAQNEGIAVDAKLVIPESTGSVPAMDLCVIMGNLLENALEACRRLIGSSAYIRVRSRVDGDALSIVVENSFDGKFREANGAYLSRKGDGDNAPREGLGLSSVKAVCIKHGGFARVEIAGEVWKTAVIVEMGSLQRSK